MNSVVTKERFGGTIDGPVYDLPDHLRLMTWEQWKRKGGGGLSHLNECAVARKLGKLTNQTLGEIDDAWKPAGRNIAGYYYRCMGTNDERQNL
jgi:hypothetical protein